MYYLFERSWGNVHKDFKCHAFCLSVLGNKYIVYMSHNNRSILIWAPSTFAAEVAALM